MDETPPQGKKLPSNPNLEHLQRQAKDRARNNPSLKLSAAQHQLAQEYGFKNWAELARAVATISAKSKLPTQILCQQCRIHEATVHLSVIVSGKKTEEHLCTQCAAVRNFTLPETPLPSVNKNVFLGRKGTSKKLKEIEFSARIPDDEFRKKLKRAREFLALGRKVKLRLKFRGREMAHIEIGFQVMKKAVADLAAIGHPDANPKLIGRNIHVILSPEQSPPSEPAMVV